MAAVDAYGNADPNYTGTLGLSTTDGNAWLPATVMITAGGNVVVPGIVLYAAGTSESIAAQDLAGPIAGARGGLMVNAAAAARLTISVPTPTSVNTSFAATVIAFDAYGNQATGYRGTVRFSSNDGTATLAAPVAFTSANNGSLVVNGFAWGQASMNASLMAVDVATPAITGTQTGILVSAGQATHLSVSGATGGPAGQNIWVTVAVLDATNNVVSGYTGTVQFSSTDAQALLPSSYTFTGADAGIHTFAAQLRTAGTQTITTTDVATGLFGDQSGLVVTPLPASQLLLVNTTSGLAPVSGLAQNIVVSAVDAFDNVDPNFLGTVTLTSSDPAATLPSPLIYGSANAGSRTWVVTFNSAGFQNLHASGPGGMAGTLSSLSVSAANVVGFFVSGIANLLAGQGGNVTITAIDAFANPVAGYVGTVRFSSTDAVAALPGASYLYPGDQGSKTFPLALYTAGSQAVTVTDATHPHVQGTQSNIQVQVRASRFKVTAPSVVAAAVGFNITVAATDVYGNIDPNYTGTVILSSSDAAAVLPGGNIVFVSGDHGQKTIAGIVLYTAGNNQAISANDVVAALSGARMGITVTVGGVTHFQVTTPTTLDAGSLFATRIAALDDANNVVTGYSGTVLLSTNNNQATLPSSVTLAPADGGNILIADCALREAGTGYAIVVQDGNGMVGNKNGITVRGLSASTLQITGAVSGLAGHVDTLWVTAADMYGNPASGYTGTVTLGSSDGQAVFAQGGFTFGLGDNGVHNFGHVQLLTAGVQTITALDTAQGLAGQQNNLLIVSNAASQVSMFGLANAVAGTAQNITVAFTDVYGNTDANRTGSVTFNSHDTAAAFVPAIVSIQASDRGQGTASATLVTAGTQSVAVASAGLDSTAQNVLVAASPVAARLGRMLG